MAVRSRKSEGEVQLQMLDHSHFLWLPIPSHWVRFQPHLPDKVQASECFLDNEVQKAHFPNKVFH